MARLEHLPIYKAVMGLIEYLYQVTDRFARTHKYGIGANYRQRALRLLERVVRAQNARGEERRVHLEELRVEAEVLQAELHVGKEVKAFASFDAWFKAVELAQEVAKQNEGWLKYAKGSASPESAPGPSEGSAPSVRRTRGASGPPKRHANEPAVPPGSTGSDK